MADDRHSQVYSELKKFNKDTLLHFIVYREFPENTVISDYVTRFIEDKYQNNLEIFRDASDSVVVSQPCNKLSCITTQADLRVAKCELTSNIKILNQMENRISDLETIISLLKIYQANQNKSDNAVAGMFTPASVNKNNNKGPTISDRPAKVKASRPAASRGSSGSSTANNASAGRVSATDHMKSTGSVTAKSNESDSGRRSERTANISILGSADNADNQDFAPATKMGWLHISKCKEGSTVEGLNKFLKQKHPTKEFVVEKVSKNEKGNVSFKLGLDFDLLDAVMVESVWPRGIQIKPFRFQRFHKRAPTPQGEEGRFIL